MARLPEVVLGVSSPRFVGGATGHGEGERHPDEDQEHRQLGLGGAVFSVTPSAEVATVVRRVFHLTIN